MQVLLAGHNYVGPGNSDFKAVTLDSCDRIAKEHDLAYAKAKNSEDVRLADERAIQQFAELSQRVPHAGIAAAGLSAKYIVESFVGVKYPVSQHACVLTWSR